MSAHKTIVEKYIGDYSRGNYRQALSQMTDDVTFAFVGHGEIQGRNELGDAIRTYGATSQSATYTIDRFIEERDSVVVTGKGSRVVSDNRQDFLFCDVFTFSGDAISRVETFQVPLKGPDMDIMWDEADAASSGSA